MPPASPILHDVMLGAGREMFVAIPLRTQPCRTKGWTGWTYIPSFFVKERFLFFTHKVALPWSMAGGALIMHDPGGHPGEANTICASR